MPTAPAEILPPDDEGRAHRIAARKHLEWMREHEPRMYAHIQAQWVAGEALNDRRVIEGEMRAIVARDWDGGQ